MKAKGNILNRREFMRLGTAALTWSCFVQAVPVALGSGVGGVPHSRLERLAKGANICRWFRFVSQESPEHFGKYISETEARLMRQMGLTHVRLCIQPKILMNQSTGVVRAETADFLDAAIERFHKAGLLVLIDLHNEDRASEADPAWQQAFVEFWGALSARLKRFDPELTMLEIINEPVFKGHEAQWNSLNARIASAIRKNAPEHTIMTSGANWGGIDGLRKMTVLEDPNVVYSFHCYDPFAFTHQGATWAGPDVKPFRNVPYPSTPESVAPLLPDVAQFPGSKKLLENYGDQRWNKTKLAARFKEGIEWGARNKVPLYCGEFGVLPSYAKPEHRANWFRDFGEVLAENRIGWAVWGWDEGFGLNRVYKDGKPEIDKTVAASLGLKTA